MLFIIITHIYTGNHIKVSFSSSFATFTDFLLRGFSGYPVFFFSLPLSSVYNSKLLFLLFLLLLCWLLCRSSSALYHLVICCIFSISHCDRFVIIFHVEFSLVDEKRVLYICTCWCVYIDKCCYIEFCRFFGTRWKFDVNDYDGICSRDVMNEDVSFSLYHYYLLLLRNWLLFFLVVLPTSSLFSSCLLVYFV